MMFQSLRKDHMSSHVLAAWLSRAETLASHKPYDVGLPKRNTNAGAD